MLNQFKALLNEVELNKRIPMKTLYHDVEFNCLIRKDQIDHSCLVIVLVEINILISLKVSKPKALTDFPLHRLPYYIWLRVNRTFSRFSFMLTEF
jgi:hypothetical protein